MWWCGLHEFHKVNSHEAIISKHISLYLQKHSKIYLQIKKYLQEKKKKNNPSLPLCGHCLLVQDTKKGLVEGSPLGKPLLP